MIRVFNSFVFQRAALSAAFLAGFSCISGCSSDNADGQAAGGSSPKPNDAAGSPSTSEAGGAPAGEVSGLFALGSVVIGADDTRQTYLQTLRSLEDGPFGTENAIEMPGNGVFLAQGDSVFAGLAEEPTWVRYTSDREGKLTETGRLSFLDYGLSSMDYGNAIVSDEIAVSVLSKPAVAVVWNPQTMEITREIDLGYLVVPGYDLENWTTIAHEGLVYVPGRWANWEDGKVRNGVSTTILDPVKGEVVGVAEDDRCASGGRVVFDEAGYAYVMGDGRNYSIQMFANAAGEAAPDNCILRIAPGETDFEEDFFYTVPSLTGGLQSITELDTARQGSGLAFARMFDPSKLPDGVEAVDFGFWSEPAHKTWRIELGDPPVAKPVDGLPYAAIGFDSMAFRGQLYTGESVDGGATSDVYEVDPDANHGELRFKMTGYFNGLYELRVK